MTAMFECFFDDTGAYRFCLRGEDGDPVLWSAAFRSATERADGIASTRRNGWIPERFVVDTNGPRRFQFTLRRANGQVLGRSRYYPSESICFKRLISLGRTASAATIADLAMRHEAVWARRA